MRRLLPLCLSAAVVLAPSLTARADDPSAAALIERGLDLRQAQHDPEALVLFEEAQALAPSPRGQAQVALVQQALGRWASAERNLRAALAAKDDAWIVSRRPILEHAMSTIEGHLGDVEIVGAKTGVVYVDGARIDEPDALTHLRLEIGRRTLEVRAAGTYPFSRVLDVRPGEVVRVEVELHPLLDAPRVPADAPTPLPAPVPRESGSTQRALGWIALGGAGLLLATGAVGLADHGIAAGDFNGSAACTGTASNHLSSQCSGWLDDGSTGQTLAIVGFVGGGVLAALSVTLLLTAPSSKPKPSAWTVPCAPNRAGVECSLVGSF
jgi:hypothetical protein